MDNASGGLYSGLPTGRPLKWEEFESIFKPIKNHLDDNASSDGFMFETFDDEVSFVKSKDNAFIWTLLDSGEGGGIISSGWHFVNRLGYFICEVPVPEGTFLEVDDDQDEGYTIIARLHETDDYEIVWFFVDSVEEAEARLVEDFAGAYDCTEAQIKSRGYDLIAIFEGKLRDARSK